ncbi:ArsR/SmtB family transcription factor [Pseudomonas sp. CGJS7]|uniref:ArsR/SmtB family transcription factor n=1 Tax=Pseudomonas sp. CGJS7 TaxID=3109348 RepID=UPI003009567E
MPPRPATAAHAASEHALAEIAAAIGDPARASMLLTLLDGRSRSAGELAAAAGVAPQTASTHLARLSAAALIDTEKQGRHRYHRLASSEVADAVEALLGLSGGLISRHSHAVALGPKDAALRHARSCYDHLAGELAVAVADAWQHNGWIAAQAHGWTLTAAGGERIARLGIALPDPGQRRPGVRACLDWSERRPHIGGQLGANLLDACLAQGLLRRRRNSRSLDVTDAGARVLRDWARAT